jgi:uncharacterized protein YbbC (DUF1343 family)/CubicO group peptidase (beta-lactamase class C family)
MAEAIAGGFHQDRLEAIDAAVNRTVAEGKIPGGVLWVEHRGVIYKKAYGLRSKVPGIEEATEETVYDAASLTKVIATTSAVMKLVEQGKIDVEAKLADYFPDFTGEGKEVITIRQLLTHTSGLRAGIGSQGQWSGKDGAYQTIRREKPTETPGTGYRYSDINFILLGLLVEKVAGENLDVFCAREVFGPLGMTRTGFAPVAAESIAPTEKLPDGTVLRGQVHDPTARRIGGIAGHAGLFTSAEDLAKFSRMMLSGGGSLFSKETHRGMTTVQSPGWLPRRGFGWDIDSPYTGLRGDLFPIGGFGHTGWTGTSLWIDPFSETFVIFLSNRNHPSGGNALPLQRELATLAAQAIPDFNFVHVPGALPQDPRKATVTPALVPVANGIDVLKRNGFASLKGLKIGLITNHTGIDREGNATIDLLRGAEGVKLLSLFSPEHGIRGELDRDGISDSKDVKTGLPVYSLYGERRSPSSDQLAGLDALVFDIQDVGCRFYTYVSTMANCLEAAGKAGMGFIVLDRVNPIGPEVEGPVLTEERSFVATHEIPVRHGMTLGELATMINEERRFGTKLEVIRCADAPALQWFDRAGQPWRNPSPNMRSLTAATLYPGIGLVEFCNVSVGRGTDSPFEILGAPYINGIKLAGEMNRLALPGVGFVPVKFKPSASVFSGKECGGVRIVVTDRAAFKAVDTGVALAAVLNRLHKNQFGVAKMLKLLGNQGVLSAIESGVPVAEARSGWDPGLRDFMERRKPFLLYPR